MDLKLNNQIVLITGSSRGIGKGIAEVFLKEKSKVILTGRDESTLIETADSCKKKFDSSNVYYYHGDLQKQESITLLQEYVNNNFGYLNHLVCNIGSGRSVPVLEEDLNEFQRMLDLNLLSAVGVVKEMIPLLEKSSTSNFEPTSITFIGSICGVESLGCPTAYASAKSALETYAKNISKPLGKKGIRVNTVSPGNILFPNSVWEKKLEQDETAVQHMIKNKVALSKFGTVEDVGYAVAYLSSKCANFITGINLVVDGGQLSH